MDNNKGGKLLIVDDDPIIRKVLGLGLEKSHFDVATVENGEEALTLLHSGNDLPDCVLLDIRMPGLSGMDVLDVMKEKFPLISVIMLTAQTDLEIAVETMKKGAFDYIVKPVRKPHLIETIKKALHYREIQVDNLRLERENREYQRSLENKVEERTQELREAYGKLKEANLETVKILAETIEAKDPYTRGHCNRVRLLSSRMAEIIGLGKQKIETLEYGALLHDIGKIGITEPLLHKCKNLTEDERKCFQLHTVIGENILKTVEFFRPCLSIVRHHHEWYNGRGYPDGLSDEGICISARIVSIADAYDAMTSTRPYRKALTIEIAVNELKNARGSQFDPAIVDHFIENRVYEILPVPGGVINKAS
jgi:putative two-component system response regulator